jgi:hypothetical protein
MYFRLKRVKYTNTFNVQLLETTEISPCVLPQVTTTSNKFSTTIQQYNKHIYAMQECQVAKHF